MTEVRQGNVSYHFINPKKNQQTQMSKDFNLSLSDEEQSSAKSNKGLKENIELAKNSPVDDIPNHLSKQPLPNGYYSMPKNISLNNFGTGIDILV